MCGSGSVTGTCEVWKYIHQSVLLFLFSQVQLVYKISDVSREMLSWFEIIWTAKVLKSLAFRGKKISNLRLRQVKDELKDKVRVRNLTL